MCEGSGRLEHRTSKVSPSPRGNPETRKKTRRELIELKDSARFLAWDEGVKCRTCARPARWRIEQSAMVCDHCAPHCPDCKAPAVWDGGLGHGIDRGEWMCPRCGQSVPHVVVSRSRTNRAATCGREPRGSVVTIQAMRELGGGHSHAAAIGLRQCNKAWQCPTCAKARQAADARVLHAANLGFRSAVDGAEVYMMTLTIPHRAGQTLAELRQAVTRAYQRTHAGKAELVKRKRFAIRWSVRRLEVTWGPNGPHPHVHAMVACRRKLTHQERESLREWYFCHWGAKVAAQGYTRPSKECITLTVADKAGRYLAKMGLLELAGDLQKRARCGQCGKMRYTRRDGDRSVCGVCGHEVNRTQWQILQDWHQYHDKRDRVLWQTFCREIRGARRLTWSRWKKGTDPRRSYPVDDVSPAPPKAVPIVPLEVSKTVWKGLTEHQRLELIEAYEDGNLQRCMGILGDNAPAAPEAGGFLPDDPRPAPHDGRLTPDEKAELAMAGVRPTAYGLTKQFLQDR